MKFLLLSGIAILMASTVPIYAQTGRVYLSKDAAGNKLDRVYIDHDKTNAVYDTIADFPSQADVCIQFAPGTEPKRRDLPLLSDKWCRLYKFNGKYYVYGPADWNKNYRMKIIYNSIMVYYTEKGIKSEVVKKFIKKNNKTVSVDVADYYGRRDIAICGFTRIMDTLPKIHCTIIDAKQKIAVWQGLEKADEPMLMVAAENVRNFPVIIMDKVSSEKEFVFDNIAYKPIMK